MKFYERIGVYSLAIAMSFMFTACDEDDHDDGAGGFTYSFFDLALASHLWWVGHIENPNQFHAGTFTLSAGSNTISYGDMNAESTVLNNRAAPCRCVRPL